MDHILSLVRDALRLSAPALAVDPQQLCTQLVGRMLERSEPGNCRIARESIARNTPPLAEAFASYA